MKFNRIEFQGPIPLPISLEYVAICNRVILIKEQKEIEVEQGSFFTRCDEKTVKLYANKQTNK